LSSAPDGLGSHQIVRLLAAREKYSLRAHDLYQCFVRTKLSLYLCSRPALLVLITHFAFRLIDSPNLIAFEDSPRLTLELFC
jgi:hypothetical protein